LLYLIHQGNLFRNPKIIFRHPNLGHEPQFEKPCSCSIGWRVMAFSQMFPGLPFLVLGFSSYFWAIILAPYMLEYQSRSLKTRIIA